jgi:hypothetical protein
MQRLLGVRGLVLAIALAAVMPGSALAASYTFQLINNTGLDPARHSIYAMGFSTTSQLVMGSTGTFSTQSSGTISSYKIGTGAGELGQITLDTNTAFTGGRLYFFVVPVGTQAPSVAYGTQPTNPPDATFPPYTIVEITVPPGSPATIDVQTVDGFILPLTITLNGQTNVAGQQYGQPIYPSGQPAIVNRADILAAYASFMRGEGAAGQPYLDLTFSPGSFAGQAGGILNPGAYLSAVDPQNQFLHLDSSLNTVWNADVTTLFGTTTLRVQGPASGAGQQPVIPTQSYTVTPVTTTYPGTSVSLPALRFTGEVSSQTFHVFNPVGLSVLTNDAGGAIVGTVTGNLLTLNSSASALQRGMYVSGAGISPNGANSATTITDINGKVLTLSGNFGNPAPNSQYLFSKLPALIMFQTVGQMVFGNSGVFADNAVQFNPGTSQATVLGGLENFVVSALNRGVAVNATALNPGTAGGTSAVWGDQRKWYPKGTAQNLFSQNLFSLFMHAGQTKCSPIFFQPLNAAAWPNARGQTMGAAYGFAYDENGGPVPPAPVGQPEVPSKFDQNVPVGASIQLTFGPWTSPVSVPRPLPATVTVNHPTFTNGQTLVGGGTVTNPGNLPCSADFYVGILRPDESIQFFTPGGIVIGRLDDATSFRPYAAGVSLGTPFSENRPAFYSHTWDAGDQRGDYYGFIIAVTAGAVAGGTVTEDQLLGFATAPFKVQ